MAIKNIKIKYLVLILIIIFFIVISEETSLKGSDVEITDNSLETTDNLNSIKDLSSSTKPLVTPIIINTSTTTLTTKTQTTSPTTKTPTTTPPIIKTSMSTPPLSPNIIKIEVPFSPQAPFGEWSDLRQENACEEVSAIMAVHWSENKTLSPQEAKNEIIAISDWEQEQYGVYEDTSVRDTVDRIFKKYFKYEKVEIANNVTIQDIIDELKKGNLVIAPMNGQKLKNPFFTPPGPLEHMIVITGYDFQTKEFITNDSGTKHGHNYRYKENILFEALRDYPTGNHLPIVGNQKNIIIVEK